MDNKLEITWDDLPEDIKELVEWGFYTKEEAIEKYKRHMNICKYCSDLDVFMETVYYIPTDSGGYIDIPVNYCPACGRKLDE